ncbi:MAG: DUF3318 domain-containing protein [Cyanobacteria bacterium CRU_2_1]|nr:DUF3318 domain-containing protein [Cyanobacteria bacterium RU_5_0]NJR58591.1 DUF3318 domain-containing protein [Cyanobacteria bacterium CRU_2_1]
MNPDSDEFYRLIDLMPASGRMLTKLVNKPDQAKVILAQFPLPWEQDRKITMNLDLWDKLPQPQRDLLMLHTVCWVMGIRWFKVDLYQGLMAAGLAGMVLEVLQADAAGIVTAGGFTVLAGAQVWRKSRNTQSLLVADEAAIQVAQRRGYTKAEAAHHLMDAIASVAQIEGRPNLNFTELVRSQNLKAIAGLSPVSTPDEIRKE